jgi:hypothetical protein
MLTNECDDAKKYFVNLKLALSEMEQLVNSKILLNPKMPMRKQQLIPAMFV